jgi:excisionase family DNA binding protein
MPKSTNLKPSAPEANVRLLRVNNVCRRLNLPERTVRWLAKHERIRARKIDGKSWGFLPDDVETYRMERNDAYR